MSEVARPFDGIRVIEFGQFVAVPFCGQVLAEGGAEVIMVEAPEGDPNRHMAEIAPNESRIFISRNRGKHTLPLKLSDPRARPVIDALVASADVVLMNFRPGLAAALGLDPAALMARHPRLIIGEVTPFGKKGPDADLAGMDIVVQARSGLMAAMGRIVDGRPAPGEPVISDYMAAMSLAFGIATALYRRESTGRGGLVDVSLMQAAMTLANNQLTRHEDLDRKAHQDTIGRLNRLRVDGASFTDQAALIQSTRVFAIAAIYFRTFDTADGTIAVACASKGLQARFRKALAIDDPRHATIVSDEQVNELRDIVESLVRSRPSAHWIGVLNEAGVPVSSVKFPVEMFEDDQATANGMFELIDHPTGQLRVLSPPVRLDGDGFRTNPPARPFASETRSVLRDLGFEDDTIQQLIASGIAVASDPEGNPAG